MTDPTVNELIEMGEIALSEGKEFGAEEIEVYLAYGRNNRVDISTGYIESYGGRELGVGVRVTIGKKVGFSSRTIRRDEDIVDAIRVATKIAKIKEPDPHFNHLPDPTKGQGNTGIFDKNVETLNLETLVEAAKKSADKGKALGDFVKNMNIMTAAAVEKKAIVSTRGIRRGDEATGVFVYGSVKGEQNGELTTGSAMITERELHTQKIHTVGETAAERAKAMFGGKSLEDPFNGQLVVRNKTLFNFLWPLIYNVNGNNVADQRSRFTKRRDEIVASEITVVDDGTLPEGIRTSKIDSEGQPMQETSILEGGKLVDYLFDSYAALRMGEESTGNSVRSDYESSPSLSYTNLRLPHGSGDLDALRSKIDEGVLVIGNVMGSHLTNPIKGNFGLTCKNAFYVKNGEIQYPLKEVTVSGNFFDFLKNIDQVGDDAKITSQGKLPSLFATDIDFA